MRMQTILAFDADDRVIDEFDIFKGCRCGPLNAAPHQETTQGARRRCTRSPHHNPHHRKGRAVRQAIASLCDKAADARAVKLIERIKIETRWLLLSAPTHRFEIDESGYAAEREALIETWPNMRHRRVPAALMINFYELVSDQASRLERLIEIRRQRAFNGRQRQ